MSVVNSYVDIAELRFEIFDPFVNINFTEDVWLKISKKCSHNYFTSWGWISTWLFSLPAKNNIQLIVGYLDDKVVVAFFVGRKRGFRYGFLPSKTYSLNSTGDSHFDQLFIEYNSILMVSDLSIKITDLLKPIGGWDEFILQGVSPDFVSSMGLLKGDWHDFYTILDKTESSYYVDLQKIRDLDMDFLSLLSSNRRSQIRRSIKQYELEGKILIREAGSQADALLMFDDLVSLHQREWKRRNRPGAFSDQYFYGFHRDIIQNRFENGEIQLLQVYNEKSSIGYLYNFVYEGNVLFYQSGFNYAEENVYRPGLVSHYFGILHNTEKGYSLYDFLAGESQYKASLSTNTMSMYWIRLIRSKDRYWFENQLLEGKRKLASMPEIFERLKRFKYWLEEKR
ncbi:MAG: GNAT family N-acetyltransferase [Anaerolineales bacterium]|nr:GNAT family N-acetyltransferase [Anaerolineales bacterium]